MPAPVPTSTHAGQTPSQEILSVRHVSRGFDKTQGELLVLDDVDLSLQSGEIVGLLGRSGSGKSTLLRIVCGLIQPSSGEVMYQGQRVQGPAPGIAMVFQNFALFPWLTVLENVEVGLEAQRVPAAERRARALSAIDLIGLDGFENAYPREMSGGMRQRVGFARALVVNPTLLLMDEPFSALDVLTAETLRTDLLDLWTQARMPIQSVLIVTHNIEEAVLMCDRILVLSSNPGRVVAEIKVPFARPRNRLDPAFRDLVDDIYATMTARLSSEQGRRALTLGSRLPPVSTNLLAGLAEMLVTAPYCRHAGNRQRAAAGGGRPVPGGRDASVLGVCRTARGRHRADAPGHVFAESGTQERKRLFADHLLRHVPLAARIRQVLNERPGHHAPRVRFEQELEDFLTDGAARETLNTAINWGRYAEIFSYNDKSEMFSLDDVEA